MGYEPHGMASALSSGKSGVIGIVPWSLEPFALTVSDLGMINGFTNRVLAGDLEVLLVGRRTEGGIPRMLARRFLDGAAFLSSPDERLLSWLRSRSVPCVTVNVGPGGDIDAVYADNEGGVRQAIEHLIALGHKRIAYVSPSKPLSESHIPSVRARLAGFMSSMAEFGASAPPGSDAHCSPEARLAALLAGDAPPTALVCYDDWVAMPIIQQLHLRGLRVPEDMSVIGINDIGPDEFTFPALTSVRVPFEEMGKRAADVLLARIADPERPFESVKLPETLVIRKSTAPAPKNSTRRIESETDGN